MARAAAVWSRTEEKYRREMHRESSRTRKAALLTAIEDEKYCYETRIQEREMLRMLFIENSKK